MPNEKDQQEDVPWDNVRDLNGLGLQCVFIPREYGGVRTAGYPDSLTLVKETEKCGASDRSDLGDELSRYWTRHRSWDRRAKAGLPCSGC